MHKPDNSLRGRLVRRYTRLLTADRHTATDADLRRSALIIAPHQDDETLGCGGTILRKRAAGADVWVVFMTDGRQSHGHLMPATELAGLRRAEAVAACQVLGVAQERVFFLDYPDGSLGAHCPAATEQVAALLSKHNPAEVYLPYRAEPTADHQATHEIGRAALAQVGTARTVLEYPVWYWHHWPWVSLRQSDKRESWLVLRHTVQALAGVRLVRNFRYGVPVAGVREQKLAALQEHRTQMTPFLPDANWLTLHDVANGEFLDCLLQDYELFYRCEYRPQGH